MRVVSIGKGNEGTDVFEVVLQPPAIVGTSLVLFSILRRTIQSIQAMALARAGIVATRKRWLILLQQYSVLALFFFFCAVTMGFSLVMSDRKFFARSVWGAFSATSTFLDILFGSLSYAFRTLAANQSCTNLEEQCIPKRCR